MVRDQGIGISEEDQLKMYDAFHRGASVGTRPGTGLGPLLVKRCAELHGATLEVNSQIGEGMPAMVELPVFGTSDENDPGH